MMKIRKFFKEVFADWGYYVQWHKHLYIIRHKILGEIEGFDYKGNTKPTLPKLPLPIARRIWKWSKFTENEEKNIFQIYKNMIKI